MKIYVASKFEKRDLVATVMADLRRDGHEVVADWTRHSVAGMKNARLADQLREYAEQDLAGVDAADCLVFVHDPDSRGGFTEFGAALGSGKLVCVLWGRPGAPVSAPIFYFHPRVHHFDGVDELRKFLDWAETAFAETDQQGEP